MYLPKGFKNEDLDKTIYILSRYPFATLISQTNGGPFVSHLPLVAERTGDGLVLFGHLARANPHCEDLDSAVVYLIFHGPNCYITPTWYAKHDVPTWNYAVVHLRGDCELLSTPSEIKVCLEKLSRQMESGRSNPWAFGIPDDLSSPGILEKAIVGFKITVSELQAKFKLS